MDLPRLREFRLSSKIGVGVRCDAEGAYVGNVPLLKRTDQQWLPRNDEELSSELGAAYGLPVDVSPKRGGFAVIARALNEGDVARAQIATLLLRLPDPPAMTKEVPARHDLTKLVLEESGVLKIDDFHYPAKTPGGKGGQFGPKDAANSATGPEDDSPAPDVSNFMDDPTRGKEGSLVEQGAANRPAEAGGEALAETEERRALLAARRTVIREGVISAERNEIRLVARRAFRDALVKALKNAGSKLVLSEIPVVGVVADLASVYDVYRFAREFVELRTAIKAATRFANEGPHTLAQLRVSSESISFPKFKAFLKIDPAAILDAMVEKRFGPAGDGMEYHHIIERNTGEAPEILESTENIIRIPTILHEEINSRLEQRSVEFGGRKLREWLKMQPTKVRREWGIKLLRDVGIIAGE